jgi:hypothetical protein
MLIEPELYDLLDVTLTSNLYAVMIVIMSLFSGTVVCVPPEV